MKNTPILLLAIGMILLNPLLLSATVKRELLGLSGVATLASADIANGRVAVLEIDLRNLDFASANLKARFRQTDIVFFQHPIKAGRIYCGLIAVPLSAKPEAAVIELQWTDAGGHQTANIPFRIIDGKYKKEALTVDPRHVTLSKKDLERVRAEKKEIRKVYASSSANRLWYGGFERPLAGDITSSFGTQRLFNNQHQSYHRGADFRAKPGTPVYAANSGIVKLAKNLFYSGNIVIVDHGMGTFTNYSHLSKIQVQVGQHIEKGHQIGRVGATGRVSGPHLHWAVKVNGVYVDPMQFVEVISGLLGP